MRQTDLPSSQASQRCRRGAPPTARRDLATTVDHLYTFDAADTVSGTYAVTVTDRATNEKTVPLTVTRDAISPTVVLTVPARSVSTTIPLRWSATDGESGVRDYDVWYKVDDGDWVLWLDDTQSTQDAYNGDLGRTYAFRVQATDRVSNTSALVTATVKTVVVKKYYHVAGQIVAMRANGVVYYLHADHLGSTSLTTDQNGTVVAEQRYYPYGEVRWTDGTLPTDFTYTGQRAEDFGLMDYHARWYSPRLGRFISPDTLVPGASSMSLNRYMYVKGNPVRHTDPSGHCTPGVDCPEDRQRARDIIRDLEDYGVYAKQENWAPYELDLVYQSVQDLAAKIADVTNSGDAAGAFRDTVGRVDLRRVHDKKPIVEAIERVVGSAKARSLFGTVTFYDSAFDDDATEIKATVVHEIAHAWDWNDFGGPSGGLKSAVRREKDMPSQYADANPGPVEHWAETVATWVYPAYAAPTHQLGPRHRDYVEHVVKNPLPSLYFLLM